MCAKIGLRIDRRTEFGFWTAMTASTCPLCRRPAQQGFRPFCSKRCADIDLHRWTSGAYAIPVEAGDEDDSAHPAAAPAGRDEE